MANWNTYLKNEDGTCTYLRNTATRRQARTLVTLSGDELDGYKILKEEWMPGVDYTWQ